MNIFFSSDFHLNHRNIAGPTVSSWDSGYRDFSSVEEMNETIIQNMNAVIKPEDTLYFLGDFLFGMDKLENFKKFRARLNVRTIWFIRGNHDHDWMRKKDNILEVEKIVGKTYNLLETNIGGYPFWMAHYRPEEYYSRPNPHNIPQVREGRKEDYSDSDYVRKPGTIYLYAHYHSSFIESGFGVDVGIDTSWNGHRKYYPYNLEEILQLMKKRGFQS